MINYCEAADDGCLANDLRCSGSLSNQKAIKWTQIFQSVANLTTVYFKAVSKIGGANAAPWADNATRKRKIAEECTDLGGEAVDQLTTCNKILWKSNSAWNKINKTNQTTKWKKDSVITNIGAAMTDLETCKDDFVEVGFVVPEFLSASMDEARYFMKQVLDIANNLTTPS